MEERNVSSSWELIPPFLWITAFDLAFQLRHRYPLPFSPGFLSFLGQLDALGAFEQGPTEGFVLHHVAEEKFP